VHALVVVQSAVGELTIIAALLVAMIVAGRANLVYVLLD